MTRLILALLALVVFTQVETYTSRCSAQTGCAPCIRPDPDPNKKVPNKPADVTDVAVDRTEIKSPPPKPGDPPTYADYGGNMRVNVITTASDPEGDTLVYSYTVSGGRIVGQGSNVTWDLNGVLPGTYTITAGADDGCGLCGKTETRTVTVSCCLLAIRDPVCPEVQISGPIDGVLSPGANTFTANVTGADFYPTYEWIVDGGEIASGQGSPHITANFEKKSLSSRKLVTLRIGGIDPNWGCLTEHKIEYVKGRLKP